ncbi:MAG: putative quinol monooxygenase [Sphingomonas sp.]|jgi:quinol monooxygenase YgiN|uniref:putative quinol monooxygenase n=1 Tax=Sphingomonas sp. TaxID=28214 RepID=UPI0035650C3B
MSDAPVIGRRGFVGGAVAIAMIGSATPLMAEDGAMFGLIGKLKAKPGQRDALAALLAGGSETMPGCISYVVAEDLADADALWITEIWESKAAHDASLSLPAVKEAIAKGRPLIAGFESGAQTRPISGVPGATK